jgi:mono/diheme cytochrome c family protein
MLTILLELLPSATAQGADSGAGQTFHQNHCLSCHGSLMGGNPALIYTRPERRVRSLDALNAQVRRCMGTLSVPWSANDVANVSAFLNARFYKF